MQILNRSRALRIAVALAIAGAVGHPLSQTAPDLPVPPASKAGVPQKGVTYGREQLDLYANAHPYLDDSLPQLEQLVPELKGLKNASDQPLGKDSQSTDGNKDPLPSLLANVGANVNQLAQKIPDMIADERVLQSEWVSGAKNAPNCGRGFQCDGGSVPQQVQNFHYLILAHQSEQGRLLDEDRMDMENRPLGPGSAQPNFRGFVESWVVFAPGNAGEAHFRYLGEQKIHGHSTFVVAFAQIPGAVHFPGEIRAANRSVPMLLQGIAWIEQKDYQILQLRTDLLAPQLEVNVLRQTSKIRFGPVRIKQLDLTIWLPLDVDVTCEANGMVLEETHFYSKYHLYRATTRMIVNPTN